MGWLFKTRSKGNEKTNLFIFITPRVIQNPDEARTIMGSKKGKLDRLRETQIKLYQGEDPSIGSVPSESLPSIDPSSVTDQETENEEISQLEDDIPGISQETLMLSPEEESIGENTYFLQVQSFADEVNAIEAVNRLEKVGYNAQVVETEVENKMWYRVQIGGYPDKATAQRAQKKLAQEGMSNTIIIQKDR